MNLIWQGSSARPDGDDWNNPANWVGGHVPGPADAAEIDDPQPVKIKAGATDTVAELSTSTFPGYEINTYIQIDNASLNAGKVGGFVQITLYNDATFTEMAGDTAYEVDLVFADASANVLDLPAVGPSTPDAFQASYIIGFSGQNLIRLGTAYAAGDTFADVVDPNAGYLFQPNAVLTVSTKTGQTVAALPFVGALSPTNFKLVDSGGFEAIAFQASVITVAGNHQTVTGGVGDDAITVTGSFNSIDGVSGNDTIHTIGSYNRVNVGSSSDASEFLLPDPKQLHEQIMLGGRGNTVTVGDENVVLTASDGFDDITVGRGQSTLTIGAYTNLRGIGGEYAITATGGHDTITLFGDALQGYNFGPYTIKLAGDHNVVTAYVDGFHDIARVMTVTGGNGGSTFNVAGEVATITTTGLYNRFEISDQTTVTTGNGYATVNIVAGSIGFSAVNVAVHLGGSHNTVIGFVYNVAIDGGMGSNIFQLNDVVYAGGPVSVTDGGQFNVFTLAYTMDNTITAGSGYDHVTIGAALYAPQPDQLTPGTSTFHFAGLGNTLADDGGTLAVSGGAGLGTFAMGGGSGTLATGGDSNRMTVGTGAYDVTTTGSHNTFQLDGPGAALHITAGSGNLVFLAAGASATVDGQSQDLRLNIANGAAGLTITGFAQDAGALIHLTGGAGGYTNVQQVIAALHDDGHGGSFLTLGGTHGLDFVGLAPATLGANSFVIG